MKEYLKSIGQQLKNHSKSLDKKAKLTEKPWALIDDELELQKLIFKKDKTLILSKNGQVQEGSWDHFPEAGSLLIDRGEDKLLCNEVFIDEGVMILQLDGTENRYFALANQNKVPDLDIKSYLEDLRKKRLNLIAKKISENRYLEIQNPSSFNDNSQLLTDCVGEKVWIDGEQPQNGIYDISSDDRALKVQNGKLSTVFLREIFQDREGSKYIAYLRDSGFKWKFNGGLLYKEGNLVTSGEYWFIGKVVTVENGIIKKARSPLIKRLFG